MIFYANEPRRFVRRASRRTRLQGSHNFFFLSSTVVLGGEEYRGKIEETVAQLCHSRPKRSKRGLMFLSRRYGVAVGRYSV